jgi:hypothetical protein
MDDRIEILVLILSLAGTLLLADVLRGLLSGLSSYGPLATFIVGIGFLYVALRIRKKDDAKKRRQRKSGLNLKFEANRLPFQGNVVHSLPVAPALAPASPMRPDLNCSHFHGKTTDDKPQGTAELEPKVATRTTV